MSMYTRESLEPSLLPVDGDANGNLDTSPIQGWYTKSEEEWRGPYDSKDPEYPSKCKRESKVECSDIWASTVTIEPDDSSEKPYDMSENPDASSKLSDDYFATCQNDGFDMAVNLPYLTCTFLNPIWPGLFWYIR